MRRKGRDAGDALLPGYADLKEIGGGAFATVFKAVEVETGRAVALKILKVDTIHDHLIETFHREIQALAAVSDHPHIVTLYRPSTTSDGRPVLVLELCRESLAQRLRESGPLAPPDVTRIGIKIAGALEAAHRNGFLHRDMKPQNILLTQFGEPALADFGVAALQASAQMTAGVFGFTTLHAAPEMLEGHHLSPATDVYGLASTMYQLLTGRAPFAAFDNEAPASVILRILRDPVRPLREDHVPLALADLLEAALAKQPEGRPRTAADFGSALRSVESAQGWAETPSVAWGEDRPPAGPAAAPAERGPMGVVQGERGPMGVSSVPPLLPPPGDRPPPAPSVGPSLVAPEAVHRNVFESPDPVQGRSGPPPVVAVPGRPPDPPVVPAPPPPAPPSPSPRPAPPQRADRPVFVDPDPPPPGPPPPGPTGTVPDRAAFAGRPGRAGAPPAGMPGRPGPVYAAWSVAAIGVAVAVIVAAALLVAGVI